MIISYYSFLSPYFLFLLWNLFEYTITSKSTNSKFVEIKFSSSLLVSHKNQVNQVMSLLIAHKFWYLYETKTNNNFFSSLSLDTLKTLLFEANWRCGERVDIGLEPPLTPRWVSATFSGVRKRPGDGGTLHLRFGDSV